MSDIQKRKTEHIKLAADPGSQANRKLFSEYLLPYKALPELDMKQVDTGVELFGKRLSQPLVIASMTGGTAYGKNINENLARACEEMKVAFGVGSQRAALEKPEVEDSFTTVRKLAPTTVIFANMGAVQLNYGKNADDYQRVVDMIGADGLYLHLNPLQEAIQPEGDTNFEDLISKIAKVVEAVSVPVWVKEVGHGLDPVTAKKLKEAGVAGLDVAGTGGTSWAWIEAGRAGSQNLADWFSDFGWPTETSLKICLAGLEEEAEPSKQREVKLVASGGIRSPVQGLKARAMGADFYSAARPFLEPAMTGFEELVKLIGEWQRGLKIAMFACGVKNWDEAGRMQPVRIETADGN